jgi:hypothetical protein
LQIAKDAIRDCKTRKVEQQRIASLPHSDSVANGKMLAEAKENELQSVANSSRH